MNDDKSSTSILLRNVVVLNAVVVAVIVLAAGHPQERKRMEGKRGKEKENRREGAFRLKLLVRQ